MLSPGDKTDEDLGKPSPVGERGIASLSLVSISLSRMYVAGTKPSTSFKMPSHQSLLKRLNTRMMSPFLNDSSLADRAV